VSDAFLAERGRLWGLAYRILGSRSDADDVVQEAWLRWQRAGHDDVERPAAWLTTVTSRLALDRLRARHRDSARYAGPWLPEPVLTDRVADPTELADSLTVGFLALLERLEPTERVVFLLADVFREPFARIAEAVGKSPAACRQIASRARHRLRDEGRPLRHPVVRAEQERLVAAFSLAASTGDLDALTGLLAPDVELVSDGGPDRHAARRAVRGPDRVGRLVTNLTKRLSPELAMGAASVNGEPALVFRRGGEVDFMMVFHVTEAGIEQIFVQLNPAKLAGLAE